MAVAKAAPTNARPTRQTLWAQFVRSGNLLSSRIAQFDVPDLVSPHIPALLGQLVFGLFCTLIGIVIRLVTDFVMPGAGPFSLMLPTVLVATLFGRWISGMICLITSSLYAWYYVLPFMGSFQFLDPNDDERVIINVMAGFFIVCLADIFRSTMRHAIHDRNVLLLELEHRVKNNFASVASMLRLQLKDLTNDESRAAILSALGRVESFAKANSFLYHSAGSKGDVQMRSYLNSLCETLQTSIPETQNIRIALHADATTMPRDRAIVLGLLVNEIVTNSLKHAFTDGSGGHIDVRFKRKDDDAELVVSDDGRGEAGQSDKAATPSSSLGLRLIDALVAQAGATYDRLSNENGTLFRIAIPL